MKREQVPYPTNKIALLQRAVFGGIPGRSWRSRAGAGGASRQISPQRMASAASHVSPARQMALNTAAEP